MTFIICEIKLKIFQGFFKLYFTYFFYQNFYYFFIEWVTVTRKSVRVQWRFR